MSSPDTSKQLFTQSIFIAKNLATKLNSLASTIVVPTQLTEANSIILYCALECKKCNSVQDLTSFQPNVQNPAAGNEFLAVVYNLPVLHNLISLNGENSISEIQRQFYLDHIKLLNVKPLILSEKEKLRKAKVEAAWNFQPNQSVETFLNMEDSQVGKVKLPQKDKRNIMITSALPYVNNVPHLGNIIGCILSADCVARYHRNKNNNCIYICGTDEYGTATEKKAIEEGLTCQAICDKYNAIHQEVYQWFQCEFDYFGRTTTENQTEIAQNIFLELKKNGKLLEQEMDQLYDTKMDMFLADRFVTGTCPLANCGFEDARGDQCDKCGKLLDAVDLINPVSVMSKTTPIVKKSKHLFIKLDEIEPELKDWLQKSLLTDKITSKNTKAIAGQWTKKGLMPRCITRDLKWGTAVPVKGYESKVFYVWFDAPIGYISMTKTYCGQNDDWKQWWMNPENVEYFQYMGKDNVAFHSVVFPSTLIGTGQNWTKVTSLRGASYI